MYENGCMAIKYVYKYHHRVVTSLNPVYNACHLFTDTEENLVLYKN